MKGNDNFYDQARYADSLTQERIADAVEKIAQTLTLILERIQPTYVTAPSHNNGFTHATMYPMYPGYPQSSI